MKIQQNCPAPQQIGGGDFNARIGELNQLNHELLNNEILYSRRATLDNEKKYKGSKLVQFFESNGFAILNGRTISDYPANFTYCSNNGRAINDLIWCNRSQD